MFGFGCHTLENTYTFVGTQKKNTQWVTSLNWSFCLNKQICAVTQGAIVGEDECTEAMFGASHPHTPSACLIEESLSIKAVAATLHILAVGRVQ